MVRTEAGSGQTARRFVTAGRSRVQYPDVLSSRRNRRRRSHRARDAHLHGGGSARSGRGAHCAGMVEADLEGLSSHGVMLVDMYVERLARGPFRRGARPRSCRTRARRRARWRQCLGHLTGEQAMASRSNGRASTARALSPCGTASISAPPADMRSRRRKPAASASRCATRGR